MSQRARLALLCVVAVLVLVGFGVLVMSDPGDGIEEGKDYALASVLQSQDKEGREYVLIHLADRNLPKPSFSQRLKDVAGNDVVKENPTLQLSTLRKVRIRVPSQKTEDGILPAYEFIQYQYRMTHKEPQVNIPTIVPKR